MNVALQYVKDMSNLAWAGALLPMAAASKNIGVVFA